MRDAGRIGFVIRGDYTIEETYDFLDVVYYNNSSYVAKKKTTGNLPEENGEYWKILAKGQTEIISKISQLENDLNFLAEIPEEYVTQEEIDSMGFVKEENITVPTYEETIVLLNQ